MNINLDNNNPIGKKNIAIYAVAIAVCILALVVVACIIVLGNDFTNSIFGIKNKEMKTEEEEAKLIAEFDTLFNNNVQYGNNNIEIKKKDTDKETIYTGYEKKENDAGNYDIDLKIPYINIDLPGIEEYNQEIYDIFQAKAESVLASENKNIIYTLEYQAYIEDNILSLIIRSTLKQGSQPQQVVVQTYNYDLENQKGITLKDEISHLNLNEEEVQNKIRTEIQEEQEQAESLQELGYTIFSRDVNSDIYNIDNTSLFFVHNENLYIIYAYGNDALTSEMDIIVI